MFNRSGRAGNYAYAVSRVKAKKALLLKDEDYNKMLLMSVPEISRYISESGYQKENSNYAHSNSVYTAQLFLIISGFLFF